MPVIELDRLPLPSLRAYTALSVALLGASVYYAVQTINCVGIRPGQELALVSSTTTTPNPNNIKPLLGWIRAGGNHVAEIFSFMIHEPLCIWTLINMAYCLLILAGRGIQRLVFGALRVSEQQHVRDRFWNYVFYKFIFVFGVVNVQYMDEVVLWCSWFSVLGFLHLLAQLCKDRFEYLSFSPTTPGLSHLRLLGLLGGILSISGIMLIICIYVGLVAGWNTFAFMAAECVQLCLQTFHIMVRYGMHLYEVRNSEQITEPERKASTVSGMRASCVAFGDMILKNRSHLQYYTELLFEMVALLLDLGHHIHMLVWSNAYLSMASLVICMQLRYLFHELRRRFKRHRDYLLVLAHLERSYPMATEEELIANSDNCAICWDKMETARKLPCSHLFHNACLQSWLEHDATCPTCRLTLSIRSGFPSNDTNIMEELANDDFMDSNEHESNNENSMNTTNRQYHFDGSRYISWLPSFTVEVTTSHGSLTGQRRGAGTTIPPQLDVMARQVQQLFPHLSIGLLLDDLRVTHSVEATIENVLDGNLDLTLTPPPTPPPQLSLMSSSPSTSTSMVEPSSFLFINEEELKDEPLQQSSFSRSSSEREQILQRRKDRLLANARHRYVRRQLADASSRLP